MGLDEIIRDMLMQELMQQDYAAGKYNDSVEMPVSPPPPGSSHPMNTNIPEQFNYPQLQDQIIQELLKGNKLLQPEIENPSSAPQGYPYFDDMFFNPKQS